jgi:branched-chain amino acid transport system permease protein
MQLFLDQIVNGLINGSTYALVAVGMTMIFGVLRAINFAHGEYYMIGSFAAWFVIELFDVPYLLSILIALLVAIVVGSVIARFVMQRLIGVPFQIAVLATLGVSIILQNLTVLYFGGTNKLFLAGWLDPISLFGMSMAQQRIIIVVVTLLIFAALEYVIRFTRTGKQMRAVSQNAVCCTVIGIDVERVVRRTFVLGVTLAALSGALTAPLSVSIYGGMGESITLKTFAVIVIGGMGNVQGTLLAGWFLGIVEALTIGYIGLAFRDAVGIAAMITMLMWRPWGLFSLRERF